MTSNSSVLVRDSFDSISEGCFLVMPGKKRHNNPVSSRETKRSRTRKITIAQRTEQDSQKLSNDGFQQLWNGEESGEAMLKRKEYFKECWNKVDTEITDILLDMNQAAIQDICSFVDKDHDMDESLIKLPFHEIPTALVFAGVNTPDHDTQFKHIAKKLREPPSAENNRKKRDLVALLQSKDCANIKSMMKTMIEKFMASDSTSTDMDNDVQMQEASKESEDEDEDEDEEDIIRVTERQAAAYRLGETVVAKPSKCLPYDMQMLEGWYQHLISRKNTGPNPNLVIIIQDFESFEPNVLQDFLTICSEYRSRLPIVCIVGIATSTEILHQSLSKSTIGLLRIERFKLEQSEVWLNRVIEHIFLNSTDTMKFGARPYKFLLDHFYLYDFSISKVTASLKYAYMHHFYGNPLSIFLPLLGLNESEASETLSHWMENNIISQHHITHIRMLSSFRAYVESLVPTDPKKALRLLEDDDYLITSIVPTLLDNHKIYQQEFKLGINLLVLLQSQFPNFSSFTSLRKPKRLLLLEALEAQSGFAETGDVVRSLVILIRKIDEEHTGELLQAIRQLVTQDGYEEVNASIIHQLDVWESRLEFLMNGDDIRTAKMNRKAKATEDMLLPDIQASRLTKTARKVQTQSIEYIKQKGTEASKIAVEIAEWCQKTLRHCLRSFTQLPLYELVYYTNVKLHEKSFASQPRASVQTALTQPQHYINCPCCNTEKGDEIVPSEHDACILYKLYLECGRMINLYDWFVAFGCIIEREKRPRNQKLEENEVQARFIRSVAELQFLGFIKPTQRKTDHVVRLTWSNI